MKKCMVCIVMIFFVSISYAQVKNNEKQEPGSGFFRIPCWVIDGDSLIPFDILSGEYMMEGEKFSIPATKGDGATTAILIEAKGFNLAEARIYIIEQMIINGKMLVRLSESFII